MVAMETKIKHFKCISYHAKIIKFSFGHKDFHITDFITKNHSHNLRLKVYLVVSLVISYVKKIISVNTF
jgi:hypothetical protein